MIREIVYPPGYFLYEHIFQPEGKIKYKIK